MLAHTNYHESRPRAHTTRADDVPTPGQKEKNIRIVNGVHIAYWSHILHFRENHRIFGTILRNRCNFSLAQGVSIMAVRYALKHHISIIVSPASSQVICTDVQRVRR